MGEESLSAVASPILKAAKGSSREGLGFRVQEFGRSLRFFEGVLGRLQDFTPDLGLQCRERHV